MSGFTPVFGGGTVSPADLSYNALTIAANTTLSWPTIATTATDVAADIMEITASAGSLSLTLPDATQVTTGKQILIRNMGSNTFSVLNNAGGSVGTVAASQAMFYYLTDNSTAAGSWSVVQFGTGTSSADAATLAGMGLKAITTTLNQAHQVSETSAKTSITSSDRAAELTWTAGTLGVTLPTAASVGSDFFFIAKNGGSGTITFNISGSDTVDGSATFVLAPNDGAMIFSAGSSNHWYTVGKGQSVAFAFTQLIKNVAGGTDVTLTSSEAANKIIQFIGLLTANINVIFPNTVSVYYIFNNTTGAFTLTVKTAAGTGLAIAQGTKDVDIVDGTNMFGAVTNIAATTAFNLGSAASPSMTFIGNTNTGIYSAGANKVDISCGGTNAGEFTTTGFSLPGTLSSVGATSLATGGGAATIGGTLGVTGLITATSGVLLASSASTAAGTLRLTSNQLQFFGGTSGFSIIGTASNDIIKSTDAGAVTIPGTLAVTSAGPNALGGAANAASQLGILGTFTSPSSCLGVYLSATYNTVASGQNYGMYLGPTLNKNSSGTHPDFATLLVDPPIIGAGAATLTNATTLKITGAPSVGTNQRAFWVVAGNIDLGTGTITSNGSVGLTQGSTTTLGKSITVVNGLVTAFA